MPGGWSFGTFPLKWKIENFHLSNRRMGGYLWTSSFKVGLLRNTKWQLQIAPAGINDPQFVGFRLMRVSSDEEPEIVSLRWRIYVTAEGGAARFVNELSCIFRRNTNLPLPRFIRKSELLSTDTPQNNLTIVCEMTDDSLNSPYTDLNYDFEALSSDLAGLLESGFRSDFTMYCRGKIFKVHKFILLSRWPDICKRLEFDISERDDIIMTGIEASDLYALLTFIYSGKLPRKDISMELCSYLHEQCCDSLLESFETSVSEMEFVTHMHLECKHVTWEVGDKNACEDIRKGFFRVIPLEEVYPADMVINFGFEKRDSEVWLRLGMFFTGLIYDRPVFVDCRVSFINKNAVVCDRQMRQLVESNEEVLLPYFIKESDLFPNERNSKCVEIHLTLCDGNVETRLDTAIITDASRFNEVKDFRKLYADLHKSAYKKDLKLKIGNYLCPVHSSVVAARSEIFRKLIEENNEMIEIGGNFDKKTADSLINHLYGGCLLELDETSKSQLLDVAKTFLLSSLEEKIGRM